MAYMYFFLTVSHYFILWKYVIIPIFSMCYEILCNSGTEEALPIFWAYIWYRSSPAPYSH